MEWGPVSFDPHAGPLLHVASGLLLVALGAFVLAVKPRRRENLAFAGFSAGWGIAVVASWAVGDGPGLLVVDETSAWSVASTITSILAGCLVSVSLLLVALWFPRPISAEERGSLRWAAAISAIFACVTIAAVPARWEPAQAIYLAVGVPSSIAFALTGIEAAQDVAWDASTLFALLFLALRARLAQREGRADERRQYVLMTGALLLQPGVNAGIVVGLVDLADTVAAATTIGRYAAFCVVAGLWLSNAALADAPAARSARAIALLTVGLPLLGWGLSRFFRDVVAVGAPPGIGGAARTLTVLILAYAILRHQLLGIDVKVRWGISRGTIAAAFIAVFFIGSEAAQEFLGETLGSTYFGIAAAGTLVFAIAPLQRAAERLAEHAVPVATAAAGPARARGAESYRRAVRLALRDRRLTHDEEVELATVAHDLGLTAPEATRIRFEVEREAGGDGGEAASSR